MKAITLKIEEKQLELLEEASKASDIPKSARVRKGMDRVPHQVKEDIVSSELRREIDSLLKEERDLLKKLAPSC